MFFTLVFGGFIVVIVFFFNSRFYKGLTAMMKTCIVFLLRLLKLNCIKIAQFWTRLISDKRFYPKFCLSLFPCFCMINSPCTKASLPES